MHKTTILITSAFLVYFVASTSHIIDALINFIIVGQLPGSNVTLSPTMMLAIMTACAALIVFEMFARRIGVLRKVYSHFTRLTTKQTSLPKRRYGRV